MMGVDVAAESPVAVGEGADGVSRAEVDVSSGVVVVVVGATPPPPQAITSNVASDRITSHGERDRMLEL